ncbi:MAG: hypothetical protein R3C26_14270 [Calditrichia bacterium]
MGCSAIVQELLEEYEDGQWIFSPKAFAEPYIERINDEKSYLQAEVKFFT